jgi:anti-anti-sigma factor
MRRGMHFSISTLNRDGDSTVAIEGELDVATVSAFLGTVDSSLLCRPRRLIVDATRVSFLASIGAEALLVAAARCHRSAVEFGLESSPEVRRTLDLLDLWWLGVIDDGFSIEIDVGEEAVDLDGSAQSGRSAARARWSGRSSRPRGPAPSNRRSTEKD